MSLDIYESAEYPDGDAISKNGVFTQPLEVTLPAGNTSSAIPLWLCTADTQFYYDGITVTPLDVLDTDEKTWIQLSLDGSSWQAVGAALTIPGAVGPGADINQPFFARFIVPSGEDAQIKTDLRLRLNYTKHAVAT